MKSLICSIALLLSAFVLQAQTTYPIRQNIGAATTLVKTPDYGGLQAGIIPYSFADTTAANTALTYLKWYCGAEIYTTDVAARWYRSCYGGGYRWVMISPSGAPSSSNSYLLYGNAGLFTAASGDIPLGFTVPNYGIDFTTNNTSRVILDRTGLSLLSSISDTTDNKVMTYNTSTRKWNYGYWFGSGGGGTGWNILGNAGTTAGTNFIGTTDNIDLVFKRNSVESGRFSASGNLNLGLTGTTLGSLGLSGNTSGLITIKGQAAAGTYNFNMPITAGTSSYLLTSAGGGSSPMTWTDPTALGYWKLASGGTLTGGNTITQAGNAFEMSGGLITLGSSDYQIIANNTNSYIGLGDPGGGGNNNYIFINNNNGILESIEMKADSTFIKDLTNLSSQTRIIGQDGTTERLGYITVGSGLNLTTPGVLNVTAGAGMAIGATITSATAGSVLYAGTGGILQQSNTAYFYDSTNVRLGINQGTPTSRLHVNHNANSVTQSDANGILLANATAATAGLQSISPPIILQGNGWKTNATAASQDVRFRMQVLPVQAAANPTSILQIQSSINGGAYTTPYEFASGGGFTATGTILSTSGNIQSSAGFVSASNVVNAGTQFVNQSTTALTYRTTNGGSNVTPAGFFGAPITNTAGTQAFAFDVTNGQSFTAANGTRHIARAGLNIVNLVNTAASESADLAFYTQAAGAAMAERLRITSTAFTVPTDNIYDLGSSTASLKDIYSRTLKLDGSTSGTATITPPAVAASPTLTLPIVTGTITAWVETTTASSATPTPTGDARQNVFTVTALATAPTFAAPSGTATNGNTILIRIKDDGTARAISWNAIYRGGTDIALPSTTTISKTMYCNFVYNSSDTKWDLVGLTDGI